MTCSSKNETRSYRERRIDNRAGIIKYSNLLESFKLEKCSATTIFACVNPFDPCNWAHRNIDKRINREGKITMTPKQSKVRGNVIHFLECLHWTKSKSCIWTKRQCKTESRCSTFLFLLINLWVGGGGGGAHAFCSTATKKAPTDKTTDIVRLYPLLDGMNLPQRLQKTFLFVYL